jgi:hypothetical protein
MGGRAASFLLAVFALWPLTGSAADGVPGPIIILGSYFYDDGFLRWALVTMMMCILIEGFVFLYSREYRRPFAASSYANIVSLALIVCLIRVFFHRPFRNELFISIGCAIGAFFIEYCLLKFKPAQRFFLRETGRISFWPILLGNLLTNLLMLVYLLLFAWKMASSLDFWSDK